MLEVTRTVGISLAPRQHSHSKSNGQQGQEMNPSDSQSSLAQSWVMEFQHRNDIIKSHTIHHQYFRLKKPLDSPNLK